MSDTGRNGPEHRRPTGHAGVPETFLVGREGLVVGKVIGLVTFELLTQTIDWVLLGEDIESVKTGETEQAGKGLSCR